MGSTLLGMGIYAFFNHLLIKDSSDQNQFQFGISQ